MSPSGPFFIRSHSYDGAAPGRPLLHLHCILRSKLFLDTSSLHRSASSFFSFSSTAFLSRRTSPGFLVLMTSRNGVPVCNRTIVTTTELVTKLHSIDGWLVNKKKNRRKRSATGKSHRQRRRQNKSHR